MAFTEAQLDAQIDPAGTNNIIQIQNFYPGSVNTTVYAIGVIYPYAGRSRFVDIPNSYTAAQAFAAIQAGLA